jgi:hypothetical protein
MNKTDWNKVKFRASSWGNLMTLDKKEQMSNTNLSYI